MKFILLLISIFIINVSLYAGAPAPSSSLPEPPYTFQKGTLLTINVEWQKASIKKYFPEVNELGDIIRGGIDIYFTKYKKPLTKIDYAIMWVNLDNDEKKIILAFVGPDYDSNRLIEKITEKNLNLSKSRLMLINNKVSFRTNINNKLVFNLSANLNDKCKADDQVKTRMRKSNNNKFFIIMSNAELSCEINNIDLLFSEKYNDIKIIKILSGSLFKNTEVIFNIN